MQQSYRALQNATLIAKAIILRAPTATFDITPGCLSAEVANRGSVQRRHEWHEGALVEIVPTLEEVEAVNANGYPHGHTTKHDKLRKPSTGRVQASNYH